MATTINAVDTADTLDDIVHSDLAAWNCKKIISRIKEFESSLDTEKQVCKFLITFGSDVFDVNGMSYQNPNMLIFYATLNGNNVEIIQHVSQLNFALVAAPRTEVIQKKRFGFYPPDED